MKVLIEREHGGQLRAYADSVYSGFISIERPELIDGAIFYQELSEELVKGLTRLLIRDWKDNPDAFDARLEKCEPVGATDLMKKTAHKKWVPGKKSRWYVKVVEPYTD